MQDLLNEEEFIAKKSDYNPWRCFGVFYGVVAGIILAYFIYTESTGSEVDDDILVAVLFGNPILLSFAMVFSRRNNYYLPWTQILIGIEGIMATCFITLFFVSVLDEESDMYTWDNLQVIFLILATFTGLGLLCFALMYPILRYKRKRLKQRS